MLRRRVRDRAMRQFVMNTDLHFSSARADWGTPPEFFARLHEEFSFTLDVCAHEDNAKLDRYLSPAVDALAQPWAPERCFMNPPYGRAITGKWIAKARLESERGALVVCLIPARTDTSYWHEHVMRAAEVRLVRGRLRFEGADDAAPFPSAVVIFTPGPRDCAHVGPRFTSMRA